MTNAIAQVSSSVPGIKSSVSMVDEGVKIAKMLASRILLGGKILKAGERMEFPRAEFLEASVRTTCVAKMNSIFMAEKSNLRAALA